MILYTIGDSFTYGDELNNPKKDAWPVLLSNKLGMSLINEGRSGIGNEFIVKKTIQAVSKYKPNLVIIAWTSCGRVEFSDQYGAYDIWPGYNSRAFSHDRSGKLEYRHELIKYISKHNNDVHEYRRWLRQVILLQSFLQSHSIDYIMCTVFDNQHRFKKYYDGNKGYYELIDHTRFVGWPNDGMVEWAYGTPQGPGGHPLEQGHRKIAEKIYEACNTAR
jgi:hypothetical protein